MGTPETRYARSGDGTFIAYSVVGEGPIDIVFIGGYVTHLEMMWEWAPMAKGLADFAKIGRLILFDKRGCGLSDRSSPLTDLDTRAQDLLTAMDAAGSERAVLVGEHEGGAMGAFVAATCPDRVHGLVWWGGATRYAWAPDHPIGVTEEQHAIELASIAQGWGTTDYARGFLESDNSASLAKDEASVAFMARFMRFAASPGEAMRFDQMWWETDVGAVVPLIQVPTLLLTPATPAEWFEVVVPTAAAIAGSEHRAIDNLNNMSLLHPAFIEAVAEFVGKIRDDARDLDRILATVLFTDIVDSTAQGAALGDRKWSEVRAQHDQIVRANLARFRGREIKTMGDGFLATFDGPARGVRCAEAIAQAVHPLGIEIRAGLHTGEVAFEGDDVAGLGVAIGARVGAKAGASEVLVSQTVKDLVAGSGLTFEDAGEHELKGVPDRWRLYRAMA